MNSQCFLTMSVSCLSNSSPLSSPKAYQRKTVSHLGQNDKSKESQENIALLLLIQQLPQMPTKPHGETEAPFVGECPSWSLGNIIC